MPRSASRTSVTFAKNAVSSRVSTSRSGPRSTSITSVMRPGRGDITTTRVDRYTASGIEWVTNTTVVAVSRQMRRSSDLHVLARHLVQRAERLVHQQERGMGRERAGDRHPLLHPARELPRQVLRELARASPAPASRARAGDARPCPSPSAPAAARRSSSRCATRTGPPAGTPCRSPGRAAPGAPACRSPRPRRSSAPVRFAIRRSCVDLPHPDGPISETNSPGSIVRSMSTSASTAFGWPTLKTFVRLRTSTALTRHSSFGAVPRRDQRRSARRVRPSPARAARRRTRP